MKKTVADLIIGQNASKNASTIEGQRRVHEVANAYERMPDKTADGGQESMFTVRIIAEPQDVEVLDGKLIFEKRVLAVNCEHAMWKFGCNVIRS